MKRSLLFTKKLSSAFLFLIGIITTVVLPGNAFAQTSSLDADNPDASCRSCHDDLYYLRDTGKYFCLCELAPSCIDCHGGKPGAADIETAHQGYEANPTHFGGETCACCHGDEYQDRIEKFAAIAGISDGHPPITHENSAEPIIQSSGASFSTEMPPGLLVAVLFSGLFLFIAIVQYSINLQPRKIN